LRLIEIIKGQSADCSGVATAPADTAMRGPEGSMGFFAARIKKIVTLVNSGTDHLILIRTYAGHTDPDRPCNVLGEPRGPTSGVLK